MFLIGYKLPQKEDGQKGGRKDRIRQGGKGGWKRELKPLHSSRAGGKSTDLHVQQLPSNSGKSERYSLCSRLPENCLSWGSSDSVEKNRDELVETLLLLES